MLREYAANIAAREFSSYASCHENPYKYCVSLRELLCLELTPQMLRLANRMARDIACHTRLTTIAHLIKEHHAVLDKIESAVSMRSDLAEAHAMSDADLVDALRFKRKERRSIAVAAREKGDSEKRWDDIQSDIEGFIGNLADRTKKLRPPVAADAVIVHEYDSSGATEKQRHEIRTALADRKAVGGPARRDAVDTLYSALFHEFPWMGEQITEIWHAHLATLDAPRPGLLLPPILLVGPPGVGKTRLATRLAGIAGLESDRVDMTSATAAWAIAGAEFGWRHAEPGRPVKLLARASHANPVIIVDEIDKGRRNGENGGDPVSALLPLLQRSTAATFVCPFVGARIDMSRINWVITANELDRVPDPVRDRCTVMHIAAPAGPGLRALIRRRLGKLAESDDVIEAVAVAIESGRMSLRALDRLEARYRAIAMMPVLH